MTQTINGDLKKFVNNPQAKIALDFENWQPGGGVSDHVHDGNYELKILSFAIVPKKEGEGLNAHIVFNVNGPNCVDKGKQIIAYHPIPVGDPKSPENRNKRFLNNLLYSIVSGKKGTETADALKNAGVREVAVGSFVNQLCYAKVVEDFYKDQQIGKIQTYITKDAYLVAPGPFGVTAEVDIDNVKASAADVAANPAPTAGGNGQASNPVDDAFGL